MDKREKQAETQRLKQKGIQGVRFNTDTEELSYDTEVGSEPIENVYKRDALQSLAAGLPRIPTRAYPDKPDTRPNPRLDFSSDFYVEDNGQIKNLWGEHNVPIYNVKDLKTPDKDGTPVNVLGLGWSANHVLPDEEPYVQVDMDKIRELGIDPKQVILHELGHVLNLQGHEDTGQFDDKSERYYMNSYVEPGTEGIYSTNRDLYQGQYKDFQDKVGNNFVDRKLFQKLKKKLGVEPEFNTFAPQENRTLQSKEIKKEKK